MTIAEQVEYWKKLAESDREVARGFLQRGKDLHYCLFFGHMCLEKLLKALVVEVTKKTPPRIHNLLILAEEAKLAADETLSERLRTFNAFNLEARYPDYKLSFYKLCSPEFAQKYFAQIEEVYEWVERQFPKAS